jgi:5-formyltetrahydrofolate cyclo-ligase
LTQTTLDEEKRALRERMRSRLHALSAAERERAARAVAAHLMTFLDAQEGARGPVALFASLPSELDTHPLDEGLRERGIPRALPRTTGRRLIFHAVPDGVAARDLPLAAFGVPTPEESWPEVALSDCRLVVAPGLAFDGRGHRVGWGAGFYDRALGPARETGGPLFVVGVGFDEQLLEEVPAGTRDEPLDAVCTPSGGVAPSAG